jgi:hypothetical protein
MLPGNIRNSERFARAAVNAVWSRRAIRHSAAIGEYIEKDS